MLIGTFKHDINTIRYILDLFRDLFIEFDKDFIGEKNTYILWETHTLYYFKSRPEMLDFVKNMIPDDRISWYKISINHSYNIVEITTKEDVSYIGDDMWMLYMSPIFWYEKSSSMEYTYYVVKRLDTVGKRYSEVYLMFHNKKRSNRLSVYFYAYGRNRDKYYRLARRIMDRLHAEKKTATLTIKQ